MVFGGLDKAWQGKGGHQLGIWGWVPTRHVGLGAGARERNEIPTPLSSLIVIDFLTLSKMQASTHKKKKKNRL